MITFIRSDRLHEALAAQLRAEESAAWNGGKRAVTDSQSRSRLQPKTLSEHAASCLGLLEGLVEHLNGEQGHDQPLLGAAYRFITGNDPANEKAIRDVIREVAVDGLVGYLEQRATTQAAALHLLRKYKQRSERFHRSRLRELASKGTEERHNRPGERALAFDLHSYLFDQGVDFVVEPESASGRVDIVLRDGTNGSLIVEAKYITLEDGKSQILRKFGHGLHQVARYCDDRGERTGHLVLFLNSEVRLKLPLVDQDGLQYFPLGNDLVFITEIRVGASPSASAAGFAEEIELMRDEVLRAVEPAPDEPEPS